MIYNINVIINHYYCNTIAIQYKHNTNKNQFLKKMNAGLLNKIEELIQDCPSNWAKLAAEKTGKAVSTIRKIRNGDLGKLDDRLQIELIEALKVIKTEFQNDIKKALA